MRESFRMSLRWLFNVLGTVKLNVKYAARGWRFRREPSQNGGRIHLLMNGPSLSVDISKIKNSDIKLAVNHFCDTDYFSSIKPELYLLQDSYFWRLDVRDEYIEKRNEMFRNLNKKTEWPITLLLPSFADVKFVKNKIKNK